MSIGHGGSFSASDRYFTYDPENEVIVSNKSIKTEDCAMHLGENHDIVSVGENVVFHNNNSGITFFPSWQGIKPQNVVANQDYTGIIHPTNRLYLDDLTDFELVPEGTGSTDACFTATMTASRSIHGVTLKFKDDYLTGDKLYIKGYYGTDDTGILAYSKLITFESDYTADTQITLWFGYPLEFHNGTEIYFCIHDANGDINVMESTTTGFPWFVLKQRTYVDVSAVSDRLTRVDTGVSEKAVDGVLYYSPDQCGSRYGVVYRLHHGAQTNGSTLSAPGITKLTKYEGTFNSDNCYNGATVGNTGHVLANRITDGILFNISLWVLNEGLFDYTTT